MSPNPDPTQPRDAARNGEERERPTEEPGSSRKIATERASKAAVPPRSPFIVPAVFVTHAPLLGRETPNTGILWPKRK